MLPSLFGCVLMQDGTVTIPHQQGRCGQDLPDLADMSEWPPDMNPKDSSAWGIVSAVVKKAQRPSSLSLPAHVRTFQLAKLTGLLPKVAQDCA